MSADQLSALVAAVTADPKLAERFAALTSADQAVALAAELGFTVTADELAAAVAARGQEMSEAELAEIAGGTDFRPASAFCPSPTHYAMPIPEVRINP